MPESHKILIAGIGNPLRQDDAFGVDVVQLLSDLDSLPENVVVQEIGIGGIHLVQELQVGYDILLLIDAVNWGLIPGEIRIEVIDEITDINEMPPNEKRTFLADMHYTNPDRAMMLAKALGILPEKVYILGCQVKNVDDFAIGTSREVRNAIPKAVELIEEWLDKISKHETQSKELEM